MNGWRCGVVAVVVTGALGLATACDEKPSIPQAVIDEATTQVNDKTLTRPTTQELLSGERTSLLLTPLPLSMRVPTSWKIEPVKGRSVSLLNGPTPTSDVSIQFSIRPSLTSEAFDHLIAGARKEMQQNPDTVKKLDVRPLGGSGAKLMERQTVGPPRPYTVYDAQNLPHTTTQSSFTWTLTAFVPYENAYQVYELSFIGLTKEQYDKDKDFLEGIVNTLAYGTGAAGPAGALPEASPTSPASPTTSPPPLP
jgi:hypothetical protein